MENKLSLFGTELQTYSQDMEYDDSKGVAFSDDDWSDATKQNSTIRKTGFVPGSAASSLAMNTALRQACFGSKLFGDVIKPFINDDLICDTLDINKINTDYVEPAYKYLSKVNSLYNNEINAKNAVNSNNSLNYVYTEGSVVKTKNIADKIHETHDSLTSIVSDIKSGNIIAKTVSNYQPKSKLATDIQNLESATAGLSNYTVTPSIEYIFDGINNSQLVINTLGTRCYINYRQENFTLTPETYNYFIGAQLLFEISANSYKIPTGRSVKFPITIEVTSSTSNRKFFTVLAELYNVNNRCVARVIADKGVPINESFITTGTATVSFCVMWERYFS